MTADWRTLHRPSACYPWPGSENRSRTGPRLTSHRSRERTRHERAPRFPEGPRGRLGVAYLAAIRAKARWKNRARPVVGKNASGCSGWAPTPRAKGAALGGEGVGCQSGDPTARRSDGASDLASGSGLPKLVGGIPRSGGPPFVAVMQTAHLRKRHDFTGVGTLHGAGLRRVLVQSQVRATPMVVAEVVLDHPAKVGRV